MIIIRPITKQDRDKYVKCSSNATIGIRNLPKNLENLEETIFRSEQSFAKSITKPGKEEYYFVLEDLSTGRIAGTCGILASLNPKHTCNFVITSLESKLTHPAAIKKIPILQRSKRSMNASEVCSLYLEPSYRHSGLGRLLSLSRFLFIASHRKRFKPKILAEMRGYIDEKQNSPFWEAIGRHFCNLSFSELMGQIVENKIDIQNIMPHGPIYISLLPREAQEVIGKTHELTKPALNMLLNEGFVVTDEIDAFEAGPMLAANTAKIRTIKDSHLVRVEVVKDVGNENRHILANTRTDFRACYGELELKGNTGLINDATAEALKVKNGQLIRIS